MMAGEVTMIERIPVELNLGQHEQVVGVASASKDLETEEVTIVISLDPAAGLKLENLLDIFKIKAIGFAGVKREPEDGR